MSYKGKGECMWLGVWDKRLYLPFYGKRGLVYIGIREAVCTLKHPIRGNGMIPSWWIQATSVRGDREMEVKHIR
jgi:hypothetical protein